MKRGEVKVWKENQGCGEPGQSKGVHVSVCVSMSMHAEVCMCAHVHVCMKVHASGHMYTCVCWDGCGHSLGWEGWWRY